MSHSGDGSIINHGLVTQFTTDSITANENKGRRLIDPPSLDPDEFSQK